VCNDPKDPTCMSNNSFATDYGACVEGTHSTSHDRSDPPDIKRDLITATAVIAGLSSFMFGFFTNLPVALA
jgi:adenine/guanine/hypoxanthine permease